MLPEVKQKTSAEVLIYEFDFRERPEILAGDTLDDSGVAAASYDTLVGDEELTLGAPVVNDNRVQVEISGGADWSDYCIHCLAPTVNGQVLEGLGKLEVRDHCEAD